MAAAIKVLHTSHGLSWLHILALHIEIIDSLFIYIIYAFTYFVVYKRK